MEERRPNALQLAKWALGGAAFAQIGLFFIVFPLRRLLGRDCAHWLQLAVIVGPTIVGFAVSWWAERRFLSKFRNGDFNDGELARVRSLVSSPVWVWVSGVLVLASLGWIVLRPSGLPSGAGGLYVTILPLATAGRLKQAIAPPRGKAAGSYFLHDSKPIQSEHWGES